MKSSSSSPSSSSLERSSNASFSCCEGGRSSALAIDHVPKAHLQFLKLFIQVSYARVELGEGVYPLLIIYEKSMNRNVVSLIGAGWAHPRSLP